MARVLVLGGYGFIGGEIVRALVAEGFEVAGLGRDADLGQRLLPGAEWIGADIAMLKTPESWAKIVAGAEAIVNAAGALQDGARDHLAAIHDVAIRACIAAAERAGVKAFVQISAPGAGRSASTAFLRTKAEGDAGLRASGLDWIIFKPGLVIGCNAYGGTALLRMLAAFPLVQPLVLSEARVQTVAIDDVADAVASALKGEVPMRADYDLVEDEAHSLRDIVGAFRGWLGFRKTMDIDLPRWAGAGAAFLADLAGLCGWRSALRSTALQVISENVIGDAGPWRRARGRALKSLDETLAAMPATAQERIYARLQLLAPLIVAVLSAFWIASGVIGITEREAGAAHLSAFDAGLAMGLVVAGGFIDILIGAGLLWRPSAKPAAVASALVAFGYLLIGTVLAPELWADPLGAYVKVIPAIALSAALALLLQER